MCAVVIVERRVFLFLGILDKKIDIFISWFFLDTEFIFYTIFLAIIFPNNTSSSFLHSSSGTYGKMNINR